ncbi:hypothetical protein BJ875DRAFT_533185 [Amylocarpus encephaloides]|uniref:5'-3' exoribonuclease 2 n=1 Tax=Amylocarpus encephaloides TaxID=45428 RepID=A0A9P8C860_9HELO|nr:hypothetical protein BJ875DRAFT_533185 [Amylocarpus encephaloides]
MGVPALFRWLSQKYPKIVSGVIEEQPREIDGVTIPIDTRGPNPNGEEFDNLYLDMNGIVHPCSHPEDRPAPKDEEEMMLEIFKYTDRVVNMVRPRKLLMIAIDGVAPRAKMNQQRSRRFRSAQEAKEKEADKAELLKMLKSQGGRIEDPAIKKAFDSNEITPGTPFMDILAASLRYWIALKLNTDPAWAKMKVIISDSTVPGEGEHKIMEFIRSQRSSPEHDPNTRHVIYGLDADLIMLGLATHEPHFRVLREDVFAQDSKPGVCHICNQKGHMARECTGEAKVKDGEFDEKDSAPPLKPFIWLHVSILREYLEAELYVPSQPFRFDLERALDDWVFMCFFVGNDFLPHLPSLEIRENGIDTLIAIWRDNIPFMGGYLTKDGHVDLERAQLILEGLAKQEDAIFRRRKETEDRREAGAKRRKLQAERGGRGGRGGGRGGRGGDSPANGRQNSKHSIHDAPVGLPLIDPSARGDEAREISRITHDMAVNRGAIYKANMANKSAAAALKSSLSGSANGTADEPVNVTSEDPTESPISALGKRKAELMEDGDSTSDVNTPQPGTPQTPSDEPPVDNVRLWDEGYADRYYSQKFDVHPSNVEFRHEVARAYVEGLAWVLLYYFQGCPSWDWYYPYHYAPFAADFANLKDVKISFNKGRIFKPYEQLMGVLPAGSRQAIPKAFHQLMTDPESEIIDFYPEDFVVDLNGKKFAWQGVALLPFIDSERLLESMNKIYPTLAPEVAARNVVGKDALLLAESHEELYNHVTTNFYSKKQDSSEVKLDPRASEGLTGIIQKNESHLPHGSLSFPLSDAMPSLDEDRSLCVHYEMPKSKHLHKSMLLRGVKFKPPVLNAGDIETTRSKAARSGRSHGGVPLKGDGRGRDSFSYAASNQNQRHQGQGQNNRQSHGGQNNNGYNNGYNNGGGYPPPPRAGWQPPPPGMGGFGNGPPPPPPSGYYGQGQPQGPPGYSQPPPQYGYANNGPPGYNDRGRGGGGVGDGGGGYRGRGSYRGDKLPHRTGSPSHEFARDEVVVLTRSTLVGVSKACIGVVLETLVHLLEELSKPYKGIQSHPIHVVHSELYILGLLADCCSEHWDAVNTTTRSTSSGDCQESESEDSDVRRDSTKTNIKGFDQKRRASRNTLVARKHPPDPLNDDLVRRLFDAIKLFSKPVSDTYVLPSSNILDDSYRSLSDWDIFGQDSSWSSSGHLSGTEVSTFLLEKSDVIDAYTRVVAEYLSFSNWSRALEYIRIALIQAAHPVINGPTQPNLLVDDDRSALIVIRFIACFWVDGRKLSILIQELCSTFLHLRKNFQPTVAIVVPQLITRWLERNPQEFIALHSTHKRLDGGSETLFDMSNTMFDGGRRKALLFPFQTSLLLLLPDVFEVASNMRDVKSSSISKKVSFLEMLRKTLKNRNETAVYCLTSILRVARHFSLDSDAAILSYALDVQEEVREAVFRKQPAGIESPNIDNSLMTAAFVSLTHLNFEHCVANLAPVCLAPNASPSLKLSVISACSHFARQSNAEEYQPLYSKIAEYMRVQLRGQSKARDSYPDEQYTILKPLEVTTSSEMIYHILVFLDASPRTLLVGAPENAFDWIQFFEATLSSFIGYLITDDERIRHMTSTVARKLMTEGSISLWNRIQTADIGMFKYNFWKATSVVLIAVSEKLINMTDDGKVTLRFIHDFLGSRIKLLKKIKELTDLEEDIPERAAACSKLETAFLVSLCSTDLSTCQLVTKCISLFCEESRLVDAVIASPTKALSPSLRNLDTYIEISSRDFRFTGLVAFQKRVRGLLRQMQHPTAGMLAAWETVFDFWLKISKHIFSRSIEILEEKALVEWRNYSGFLASLGGTCISGHTSPPEEPIVAGLRWIDRLLPESYDETLLNKYMKQSVQLLASNNVRIREATRETLSTELASPLYLPLFENLETELGVLFDSPRTNNSLSIESRVIFAEQASALLKSIVERLGGPTEVGATISVDVGALTLNFAKFLDEISESASVLRVKIKICQLCETVTQKKEHLNLRHDVRIRNQLLEAIFGWITRPGTPKDAIHSGGARIDEILRLQRDLDRACLKALADLTYRLPLQPPAEGQTDADTSDHKSKMFHNYFNSFLSLLNYDSSEIKRSESRLPPVGSEESTSTPELAITALSNLLSANIDVGLKHSLAIGYHEDLDVRTAFVKVLCNILIQGAEFNNLSDTAVNEKYDELLDLLINDMPLTIALCDACPSSEADEMTISLLNIFDSRGLGFMLLEGLIEHEVDQTESEAELLRRNCVATKMLSLYAKWKGALYMKATLQKVLERLVLTSKDLDLELDPARTSSAEELQKNALQLRVVTKVFIDDICNSAAHIPISFRKICSIISSAVMKRFPEAKFTAVGAFIFLRFFCPAIVAPDIEGLISSSPSKEMRRGLLLIAKVVQNLANNVLFGAKEPYMFPLNDFLTQNIYRVTTFLREISVAPNMNEPTIESEAFDFGSCVALHRFLYDHWDHVRQKIVLQERKGTVPSLVNISKGSVPMLESLRKLITNLGPPPMDVSWNRPKISQNNPPSYSRFQHFMLRNAGRNTESLVSTRAVYDGGESKDGLPMICIILRNIDTETVDYELLLFGYLKIASRMWHRPFGILIDATCYNGQNEPQDTLFKQLDLLTPTELSKQLSRVFVYNMNSAFRKCFRRILRLAAKSEISAFHPKNVDYHLIGSLQDLQAHFHLSQLHLPRETISVVTNTRYVFQPITRLSKTKGKVEVVIKVGSQFVQVTTAKKQEVVPGLRLHATVNDIFRLSEVDEAPTSIQTEDDSAFGLRTDNGKIVMYFTSPRKPDILQAIRGAKAKYGKELRTLKSFERLVRPQDVPGTLLNIALTNMASSEHVLRLASYNLLCALCRAFKFAADSKFMSTKELCVPLNPSHFIINISQQLAKSEPQLTVDFLNEFFVGWESFPYSQRPLSLAYMAPWLPSLRTNLLPTDPDSDKAREKVAAIFRKLIEVAISDFALRTTLEHRVWPIICQDELYTDIFLEELTRAALSYGIDDERTEILGSIIASLGTITIRGKLLSRLRKALNRTSLRPTRHLPDNTVWGEISVLLRLCLSTSFDSGVQSQIYLPELFHLVTMLANTGSSDVRLMVHRLLINTIHAMCTSFPLEESKLIRLRSLLLSLSEPQNDILFNLSARDGVSISSLQDSGIPALNATESLAVLLSEVSTIAAPSIDVSNAWRSRWMSLVASTAFQSNPAIQPRAFTVMGCLAREDVDDDLLYQVLVALRNSIGRFMEEGDSEMLIAIVSSLTKMMDKLPSASRYGLQLFWLALSLVRLVPLPLYNCTAAFLDAVLNNIATSGDFRNGRIVPVLLQGRQPLEDAAVQLDEIYGIHFSMESFHFAVVASLVKGLSDNVTRATSVKVLSTFLETTSANTANGLKFPNDLSCIPYLGALMTRVMSPNEANQNFWVGNKTSMSEYITSDEIMRMIDLSVIKDKELLLNVAIGIVDFRYLEESIQNQALLWLGRVALKRPTVLLHLCAPILRILDYVILNSQNTATLESAHQLLRTITSNPKFSGGVDTAEMLEDVLDGIGFGGLWRSATFHSQNEHERQCTALTDRLIELIIA